MSNISYLNQQEIDLYYKLYNIDEHVKLSTPLTVEASLLGPKVSMKLEKKEVTFDTLDKLLALWDYLIKNEMVSMSRPNTTEEADNFEGEFIYESVLAHKLIFPKSKLTEISGLNHLVVWVSEPDLTKLSEEPWTYTGTFLLLIETVYSRGEFSSTISGCSALQVIYNMITGNPFYTRNRDEPLGRNNSEHPLQKLQDIGAIYVQEQEIKTIYRKRYMSNEQCFTLRGKKYRCNDLLGYPLFIS